MKIQDGVGHAVELHAVECRRDPRWLWLRRVRRRIAGQYVIAMMSNDVMDGFRIELRGMSFALTKRVGSYVEEIRA